MSKLLEPTKTPPSVTPDGKRLATLIQNVEIHRQVTQHDDRGSLTEIFTPPDFKTLGCFYTVSIYPNKIKGWAVHYEQTDRYFFYSGNAKLVLFDNRKNSSTYRMINELYFNETNRSLVIVPPGIYHAVQNIGLSEVLFFNFSSHPYQHHDPDKYILPLKNDLIPYEFIVKTGY